MTIFILFTIFLIFGKAYCMMYNKLPSDMIGLVIIAALLLTGTIPTTEALACFSASTVALIAVLSVLVAALVHSGVLQWIVKYLLGQPRRYKNALARLMVPVAFLSSFISNGIVVYMFVSVVRIWSKKLHVAPSRLLIPLSYASNLGGLCTLIGAAPNLVIAEFYTEQTGLDLSLFAPLIPGFFCMAVGILSIIAMHRMLPVRRSPEESFLESQEYTVELLVPTDCPHVGETVEEARLSRVSGGQLIEIVRFDLEVISPVPNDEFILGGDRLVYSGQINDILELRNSHGLVNATHHVFNTKEINPNRQLQMATINNESPLTGQCMADLDFEDTNHVVLVAIAREGQRLHGIPREMTLRPGDTLLLEGEKLKPEHFTDNLDFFDTVPLPQSGLRTLVSSLVMVVMVLLTAFDVMPLLNSAMLAAMLMVLLRCISFTQLQKAVNWKLLLVFAGSVCLGRAIEYTGLSTILANSIQDLCGYSSLMALIIICLTGTIITEFVSNASAAAMLTPIALATAQTLGANPMTFIIGLMIAVNCSFASPLGNETHILVYGPGGYRFGDFARLGIPLNIIMLIANIFIVTIVYPL